MKKILLSLLLFLQLYIPLHAQDTYIYDTSNTLTTGEKEQLESKIDELVQKYQVGIYVYTTDSRTTSSIEEYSEYLYTSMQLGVGSEKNGLLLVLDFSDRSYDIVAYGNLANKSFTDYGKSLLEDAMLDDFGNGDWFAGYFDYLSEAERQLYYSVEENSPIDINNNPMSPHTKNVLSILVPSIVALLISIAYIAIQANKNKTRGKVPSAAMYFTTHLRLTRHLDLFISSSRSVIPLPRNNSHGGGGGTSINSGGFSHSSGHF